MSKDKILRNFAESLYIEIDKDGKRRHSLRYISKLLKQKYDKKVHFDTVGKWSKRYQWDEKIKGVKNAIIKTTLPADDVTIQEKILYDLAKDYKNATTLANIGYDCIFKKYDGQPANLSIKESIYAIKVGTEIKNRLMGFNEDSGINDPEPQTFKIEDQILKF